MKRILTVLVMLFSINFVYGDTCTSVGTIKERYTANECGYTTQKRECCSNGNWSPWVDGSETPHCCPTNHCWNGSICQTPAPTTSIVSAPSGYYNVTTCTYLKFPTNCIYGQGFEYQEEGSLAGCSCVSGYSNFDKDAKRCYKCEWINHSVSDIGGQYTSESAACANFVVHSDWDKSNGNPTFAQWKSHGNYYNDYACTPIRKNIGSYVFWSAKYDREFFTCN